MWDTLYKIRFKLYTWFLALLLQSLTTRKKSPEQGFATPGKWCTLVYKYNFPQTGEAFCSLATRDTYMCLSCDPLRSLLMAARWHGKWILCWQTISQWQMSIMIITRYWIITSVTCLTAWELAPLFRIRSNCTAVKLPDFVLLQTGLWPEVGPIYFSQRFRIT